MFLGKLADLAGGSERVVAAGPLDQVLADLEPDLALALLDERVRIALNGELAGERALVLSEDDELAFLPPVSGG